jgi:hypothetical protein
MGFVAVVLGLPADQVLLALVLAALLAWLARLELRAWRCAPPPPSAALPAGVLDVKAFGAIGDGKHDDTDAVALALSSLGVGETLLFTQGTYVLARSLDVGGDPVNGLKAGQTLAGTAGATIVAAFVGPKWWGEHCFNIFGPSTTVKDLVFTTAGAPNTPSHPSAFGGLNFTSSAAFSVARNLSFRVRLANIRACIVCDARGVAIRDSTFLCQNSPGHGIYLSGGDYNVQQPFDIRIEGNHFQDIGDNAIQVQNANATGWVLEGVTVVGNIFRDCNVGVMVSESYCGLKLKLPIIGPGPDGMVTGMTSGAMGKTDPSQWQAVGSRGKALGCLRVSPSYKSYPKRFQVGETLTWSAQPPLHGKGSGQITAVAYDRVSRLVVANNQFLNSAAKPVPDPSAIPREAVLAETTAVAGARPASVAIDIAACAMHSKMAQQETDQAEAQPTSHASYGVYVGDSARQLNIMGNVFYGMSIQAVQLNSTGAIKGVGDISIASNIIDCADLGLGIWYRRLDGISIQGNVVSRSADRTGPTPGILEADDVTRALVVNNLAS